MNKRMFFPLTLLSIFILLISSYDSSAQRRGNRETKVLVPLYMYPYEWNGTKNIYQWTWITDAQKKVNISAVVNPNNGPLPIREKDNDVNGDEKIQAREKKGTVDEEVIGLYNTAIQNLNNNEVAVYAYIKTGWMGTKSEYNTDHPYIKNNYSINKITDLVKADLKSYKEKYIDEGTEFAGIFFDEVDVSGDATKLQKYTELYNEVKKMNSEWKVILNPGTNYNVAKLESRGDIIVTYENKVGNPNFNFLPAGKSKYAAMVYNTESSIGSILSVVSDAQVKKYGYVYVTDDTFEDNPYDNQPSSWDKTIGYIKNQNDKNIWQLLSGSAKEIASNNGKTYILDNQNLNGGHGIHSWSESQKKWIKRDGAATSIAVDDNGKPWVVNSYGEIFNTDANGKWEKIEGREATDIACGGGKVFIISKEKMGNDYKIYYRAGNSWIEQGGAAVRVAVDDNGKPWVVNSSDVIYKTDANGKWKRIDGQKATDISCRNGQVYVIGNNTENNDHGIYQLKEDNKWVKWLGAAKRIAVDEFGYPWVVNSNGNIFN